MEPEGSLLHSQASSTRPYQSTPWHPNHCLNSHINIILPSTPTFSKWSLSLRSSHHSPVCTSLVPHACHMPCSSHSSYTFKSRKEKVQNHRLNTTLSVCKPVTCFGYTGCPRRNVPDFGRVFLMLKYTDITQNTHVQSWTVTEIKVREKCGLLAVPRTVPGSRDVIPIRCALSVLVYSRQKRVPRCDFTCKVLGNPKDNYDMSASVFVVQFNGFMPLTS